MNQPTETGFAPAWNREIMWLVGGLVLLGLGVFPLLAPQTLSRPLFSSPVAIGLARAVLLALPVLAAVGLFRSSNDSRQTRWALALVALLAAVFCEHLHHQFVDKGHYGGGPADNTVWQRQVQAAVIALDPGAIPHSYRFLSHAYLAIFEWLSGSFEFGRGSFRILCNVFLFGMILRYGRLYLTAAGAVLVVLLTVMIYPVTIAWYAGQPVDPLSHLSFIVCLYCFAARFEAGVAPSLVLGVLAKESVVAAAACRVFWGPRRGRALALAVGYVALALATLALVRLWVNSGRFAYDRISGVGPAHLLANLRGYDEWVPQYLFTLGILIPGALLGWRLMERPFRLTCLVLTLALVVSSALFSWLNEVRNLVPAVVMLLIINVRYLEARFLAAPAAAPR